MENLEQTPTASDSSYEELFTSFPATSNVFQIKRGWPKKSFDMNVDNLRLFSIVFASDVKWRVTITSHSTNIGHLDLLPEENAYGIYEILEKAMTGEKRDYGINVCLAEYGKEGMLFKLTELREYNPSLLAALYRCQHQRKERLRQWLAGKAEVTLTGSYGSKVILDKESYRSGRKVIPWSEVGLIKIESSSIGPAHMYILPKGSSGGMFSSWRAKASLTIPKSKSDLYVVECNFWRTLSSTLS